MISRLHLIKVQQITEQAGAGLKDLWSEYFDTNFVAKDKTIKTFLLSKD